MIIDAHTHIYPERIADKAVKSVTDFYGIAFEGDNLGMATDLLSKMREAGISYAAVSSVATVPRQVEAINRFLLSEGQKHKELIPLAALHPELTDAELFDALRSIKEGGFAAIKMHPDFQEFELDGKAAYRVYEKLDGTIPVKLHTGDPRKHFSAPARMIRAAKDFPHLSFLAAHFGGWSEWDAFEGYQAVPNVWFDTSSSLPFLTKERAKEMITTLGAERFLFGTDYPMWNPKKEIKRLKNLGLSLAEENKIFYENAAKFYGKIEI